MKILFVSNSAWNLVNFRSELIKHLIESGHDIEVLAPHDQYAKDLESWGCHFTPIILSQRGKNFFKEIRSFFNLFKAIRVAHSDLILSFTIKPNIYCGISSRLLNIPIIANITGMGVGFININFFSKLLLKLYKIALANCRMCLFQNKDDLNFFLNRGIVKTNQATLIPGSGVNLEKFKKRKNSLNENKNGFFTFFFYWALFRRKGSDRVIQCI